MAKKIKVEQCPPGIAVGAIETIVDRGTKGWQMGAVGFGAQMKEAKGKKGKLKLNYRRRK